MPNDLCGLDTEGNAGPADPLAALEKSTDAKNHQTKVQIPRLESLMDVSEQYNSDPYSLSLKVRKHFREDKKVRKEKEKLDTQVKDRYALPTTLSLVTEDAETIKDAKEQWQKGREEISLRESKRRKLGVQTSIMPSSSRSLRPNSTSSSLKTSSSSAAESLRARILGNTARQFRPTAQPPRDK